MPSFKVDGMDAYITMLEETGESAALIAKKALYEGAGMMATRVRSNLNNAVSKDATGDLAKSIGISPITLDKDGNWSTRIGFSGYDRKGVPNVLKARVLESGSSKQKKRPFVRPAVNAVKGSVEKRMKQIFENELRKRGV